MVRYTHSMFSRHTKGPLEGIHLSIHSLEFFGLNNTHTHIYTHILCLVAGPLEGSVAKPWAAELPRPICHRRHPGGCRLGHR